MGTGLLHIFASSPFKPLQGHMETVYHTVEVLLDFFDAVLRADWEVAMEQQALIVQLEEKADNQKKEIRLHLPNGLFLPVSRSDLLRLLTRQDEIANKAKDIAGLVLGRRMQFPAEIVVPYQKFLRRSCEAIAQAYKVVSTLDELLETGFKGKEAASVEGMIVNLDTLEDDTDHMEVAVRGQLFALEAHLHPVHTMFLYKIIDWTGDLANDAQHVGHSLELLLAR